MTPEESLTVLRRMSHPGITSYSSPIAEVDAIRYALATMERQAVEIARLQAELAAVREDGERYRWLREDERAYYDDAQVVMIDEDGDEITLTGKALDAAIDAARRE